MRAVAALLSAHAALAAPPILGVEFSSVPAATCDVIPLAPSRWTVPGASAGSSPSLSARAGDRPAAVDADGWPAEDAFLIPFIATPDVADPAQFIPRGIFGAYALSFEGRATITLAPQVNATVSAVSFDAATWTTTATVTLSPPVAALGLGFFSSQRRAGAPAGSGVASCASCSPPRAAPRARRASRPLPSRRSYPLRTRAS
jgi:hypothetical protein